jgi:hypothetical protein
MADTDYDPSPLFIWAVRTLCVLSVLVFWVMCGYIGIWWVTHD